MRTATDARLVLRWTCQACGQVNYHAGEHSKIDDAAKTEAAEAFGCRPEDLACMPDKLHCIKCEEPHKLPDDFGVDEGDENKGF